MTAVVQKKSSNGSWVLDSTPVDGNTLVWAVGSRGTLSYDPAAHGWTAGPDGRAVISGVTHECAIFYKTAASETGTYDTSDAAIQGVIFELSGTATPDTHAEATGTTVTSSCGPITAAAASVTVGVVVQGKGGAYDSVAGSISFTSTGGWTEDRDSAGSSGSPSAWVGHQASTGALTLGTTNSGNGGLSGADYNWASQVLSFSGASAAEPGGGLGGSDDGDPWIDITDDLMSWTITRGASAEITGSANPGSATIMVRRRERDGKYNPLNASSPLYGILRDGCRIHLAINDDGTMTPAGTVVGLFAGRITDISQIQTGLEDPTPVTEIVCEDPLAWYGRTPARVADSRTRSHRELRLAVLAAIDETRYDLANEIQTMPLSSADGNAFDILGRINGANGTRHFAKPADNHDDWYAYTTRNRQYKLTGVADQSIDAASEHLTDTTGWRYSADTVTNQQQASVEPIQFLDAARIVWTQDSLPLVVEGSRDVWVEFPDFIDGATVESDHTGSSATVTLTSFGRTGKIAIVSSGTTTFQSLLVRGYEVVRGDVVSHTANDLTSQAGPRGVRAGSDISGDYVGVMAMARGIAEHIVWRYGNPQLRPTITIHNWFPEQFTLDLYDTIAVTTGQFMSDAVIFEIVGLTHVGDIAASGVVHHTVTYVLQESRTQTDPGWFVLDTSELDGPDILAY